MVNVGDRLLGYATDPDVRNKGASGGLVTAVMAAALEKGLVDGVLVLKRIDEYEAVPIISEDVQEVLSSGGSMHTVPANLAKYASGKRIVMPAKPCDVRGVIERSKRNDANLDNTYIVGLNCGGTMHPAIAKEMLIKMYEIDPDDVIGEDIEKGKLIFKTRDGTEKAISIDELDEAGYGRRENCRYCTLKIPVNADLACGNWGVTGELVGSATFCEVMNEKGKRLIDNAIEAGFVEVLPANEKGIAFREKVNASMVKLGNVWKERLFKTIADQERLTYYIEQFADCIHCDACREVCPVCTCGVESKCTMFHSLVDDHKISMYHMVRLLHLADSCIGCGQCTDVCPVDIPLATIFRRFAGPAQQKRDYEPGMDMSRPPFLEVMLK